MRSFTRYFVVVMGAALVLNAVGVARGEDVPDPRYKVWAKYKVGSSSSYTGSMNGGTMPMQMQMTMTLQELTDDHATLEVSTTMTVMGQPHTSTRTQQIPAHGPAMDVKVIGEEDVQAIGKTFKCKVIERASDVPTASAAGHAPGAGGTATAKVWESSDVPGGMVKLEVNHTSPNGQAGGLSFVLSAVDIK